MVNQLPLNPQPRCFLRGWVGLGFGGQKAIAPLNPIPFENPVNSNHIKGLLPFSCKLLVQPITDLLLKKEDTNSVLFSTCLYIPLSCKNLLIELSALSEKCLEESSHVQCISEVLRIWLCSSSETLLYNIKDYEKLIFNLLLVNIIR